MKIELWRVSFRTVCPSRLKVSYSFYNSLGKIWCYFFLCCVWLFFTEMNVSLLQEMDSLTLPLSTSYLHFVCTTLWTHWRLQCFSTEIDTIVGVAAHTHQSDRLKCGKSLSVHVHRNFVQAYTESRTPGTVVNRIFRNLSFFERKKSNRDDVISNFNKPAFPKPDTDCVLCVSGWGCGLCFIVSCFRLLCLPFPSSSPFNRLCATQDTTTQPKQTASQGSQGHPSWDNT